MIASYSWLIAGEMPSQRLRSYTFGVAAAVGFLGAWLITFTAPYFINPSSLNWGPRYGYIWFPSCIVSAVWVFFFLPEVKGRTLEEIDVMVSACPICIRRSTQSTNTILQFNKKLPARHFRTHKLEGEAGGDVQGKSSVEVEVHEAEKV